MAGEADFCCRLFYMSCLRRGLAQEGLRSQNDEFTPCQHFGSIWSTNKARSASGRGAHRPALRGPQASQSPSFALGVFHNCRCADRTSGALLWLFGSAALRIRDAVHRPRRGGQPPGDRSGGFSASAWDFAFKRRLERHYELPCVARLRRQPRGGVAAASDVCAGGRRRAGAVSPAVDERWFRAALPVLQRSRERVFGPGLWHHHRPGAGI